MDDGRHHRGRRRRPGRRPLSYRKARATSSAATAPWPSATRPRASSRVIRCAKSRHNSPAGPVIRFGASVGPYSQVSSPEGDVVGYNGKQGVHARLIANLYSSPQARFQCDAGNVEQSTAIFSASACGLYGYDRSTYLENLSGDGRGAFRLASRQYTVEIQKGSAALLEAK